MNQRMGCPREGRSSFPGVLLADQPAGLCCKIRALAEDVTRFRTRLRELNQSRAGNPASAVASTMDRRIASSLRARAKQSRAPRRTILDCFVAGAPRNDGETYFCLLAARSAPESCRIDWPSETRGRREGRVPTDTHGPRATKSTRQNHRFSRSSRPSLRNGFTAYSCSPRCAGLFGHRQPHDAFASRGLAPASGCQDHTTSPSATSRARLRASCPRPSQPASTYRDDAYAPLR